MADHWKDIPRGFGGRWKSAHASEEDAQAYIDKCLTLYDAGFTFREVAQIVGRHPSTVRGIVTRHGPERGIHPRPRSTGGFQKLSDREFEQTAFLYSKMEWTVDEIADYFGRTRGAIIYRLRRAGVPRRTRSEAIKRGMAKRRQARQPQRSAGMTDSKPHSSEEAA